MKTSIRVAFAALLLAAIALLPAAAQDFSPSLTFSGNVQICSGATAGSSCRAAIAGEKVPAGSHMMVGPGASAQLTYPTGAIVNFTEPGLYTVSVAPAGMVGTMTAGSLMAASPGFIAFAGLIAAAGVSSSALDDDENLLVPISE